MKFKKSFLIALNLSSSLAFAHNQIIGDVMDRADIPNSVCSVEIISESGLGQCTGSLIEKDLVLTARHCFHNEKDFVLVSCGQETYIPTNISLGKDEVQDVAVLRLDKNSTYEPMKIMNERHQKRILTSQEKKCAVFGFGTDNKDNVGELNGVIVDSLSTNSEHLISFAGENLIQPTFMKMLENEKGLEDVYQAFVDYNLSLITLDELNLIISENEKAYLEFDKKVSEAIDLIIASFTAGERANFYYEVTSKKSEKTAHTSGFLPGDSGGPLMCEFRGKMQLMGINVLVLDEDKTNNKELSIEGQNETYRVFEKGLTLPIKADILEFIKTAKKK